MKTTLKKLDKFYHTPWIYLVSISFVWIVSIFGILPFALNPNGTMEWGWGNDIIRHSSNAWLGWLILGFSFAGGTFAVIGEISIANNSKKYVIPITLGRALIATYCILVKLWFLTLTSLAYALIGIINCRKWEKQGSYLVSKMTFNNHIITAFIAIAFLSFGLGTTLGTNPLIEDPHPYLDVIFSTMTIVGWLHVSQKNKWGWILFVLSDIGFIIIYLMMFNMSLFAGSFVYFFFDTIAAFRWFNWEYAHYNLADSLVEKYVD